MFRSSPTRLTVILIAIAVGLAGCGGGGGERVDDPGRPETSAVDPMPAGPPLYELDPSFPPELPNSWVMGVPSSVAVDSRDHIWVLSRPRTVPEEQMENAAPAVMEFDASGAFVQGWGGPGDGFDWPDTEHGIFVATLTTSGSPE